MLFVPKVHQDDVEVTSGKSFLSLFLPSDDSRQLLFFFFTGSDTWLWEVSSGRVLAGLSCIGPEK